MSTLSELGLNRWGYKAVQQTETTNSSNMSADPTTYKSQTEQSQNKNNSEDAKNIQTGTVIKNVFFDYIPQVLTSQLGFLLPNGTGTGSFIAMSPSNLTLDIQGTEIVFGPGTIGDAFRKVTLNGSVVACPLPTVSNALDIIRKIPEPTNVGDRGHYGDGLYFDDLTFPEEVLWEVKGKKEIEHTKMIGLLMKAVVELTKKVDKLEDSLHY